jgi:hypothetical protein
MAEKIDAHDGDPWTEMDIRDRAALTHGSTIEEAAQHLCRSGTIDDVAARLRIWGYISRAG